jgi:hypothetical protein
MWIEVYLRLSQDWFGPWTPNELSVGAYIFLATSAALAVYGARFARIEQDYLRRLRSIETEGSISEKLVSRMTTPHRENLTDRKDLDGTQGL